MKALLDRLLLLLAAAAAASAATTVATPEPTADVDVQWWKNAPQEAPARYRVRNATAAATTTTTTTKTPDVATTADEIQWWKYGDADATDQTLRLRVRDADAGETPERHLTMAPHLVCPPRQLRDASGKCRRVF